jgi:hypothetical protein
MNKSIETLALMKTALSKSVELDGDLNKSVSTATGLVAFDLQAPSKNLYPVQTPLRNVIPRVGGGKGLATNWKQILGLVGSGVSSMGWVPEGQRSGRMSYQATDKSASYVTLGEEDQITFEAISAGRDFEDVQATASMRLLQQSMIKEEHAILGGNSSVALGTPATPTTSASGSGATLGAATYNVIAVALTYEGFRAASLVGGVVQQQTITGADGATYTLNGGSSNKSTAAAQAVTLGQTLFASVAPVNGAVGYAWYIGTSGNEKLEAITTINSVSVSAPLVGGVRQAATAITADRSQNSLAFDGILSAGFKSGSGAYIKTMSTGTAGTGTGLTASSRGTVVEIDEMLRNMWDAYQMSPDVIYVNAQELDNISKKCLTGPSSSPLLQIYTSPDKGYEGMLAGGVVGMYFNPFTLNGGQRIPIKLHPFVPRGTLMAWCSQLPLHYQSNNVPNVIEMKIRQEYYQLNWPLKTRSQEMGVYVEETLAVYAPFAVGIINNIGNS